MKKLSILAALLWALICPQLAFAQGPQRLCFTTDGQNCITVGPGGAGIAPLPVGSGCDSSAVVSVSAGATTQIVGLTAGQTIRVCSFVLSGDTLATTALFAYGTGTNCASGTTSLTGAMRFVDEGNISFPSVSTTLTVPVSNALCVTTATGAVTGFITYSKR